MASLNLKRFLVVTALAAGAALAHAQPMGPHGRPGMMGGEMHMWGHELKAVGATDAQRDQIKQIMKKAFMGMKAQHETLRALHKQGEALFAAPSIDAKAVMALHAQAQATRDAIGNTMAQALLDSANVLSSEQRAKIYAMQQKREARMEAHMKAREAHMKAHMMEHAASQAAGQ